MGDELELTLKVTLNRKGLKEHLRREVEADFAFFVLGLVNAQLTETLGERNCTVGLATATGFSPYFLQRMNHFARLHRRASDEFNRLGEVIVADQELVHIFEMIYDVTVTPLGERWRITSRRHRREESDRYLPEEKTYYN